jgi:hypothetical protein
MSQAAEGPMPASLRLQYAESDTPAPSADRRRWRVLSLVALSPGLVLPFLPMECDASAVEIIWAGGKALLSGWGMKVGEWGFWLLSMPFFLIYPLVAWKGMQLAGRGPTRRLRAIALALGAWGGAGLFGMLALSAWNSDGWSVEDWAYIGGATVALGLVVWLEIMLLTRPGRWGDQVTVALLGPYAVTLALCVFAFARSHDVGWYFAIAPAAVALVELVVIARSVRRGSGARRAPSPSFASPASSSPSG